jgi:DNA polymerase-4
MRIVRAHVEALEVVGLDEAYVDLSGVPAPGPTMRLVRSQIERTTGLGCSIGIGPSKLVAKVASEAEKPGGFVVLSREQACERFAASRCGLVPGIGPKTVERLRTCGIVTLSQLAAAPASALAEQFGTRLGAELQRRARFEDDAPVTQERKVCSESREVTFDCDISDRSQLEAVLARLVERLSAALTEQRRHGRTVGIKVRLDDFSTHTRARTLPEAVDDAARIGPIALDLLRRFDPPRPVRLLGVRVAGLEHSGGGERRQLSLAL